MRNAFLLCLTLLGSVPAVAQEPPPQAVLREIFHLDDGQLKALEQLLEQRGQAVKPVAEQLGHAQRALAASLESETPDPTSVGNAMLTVRNLQRQIELGQRAFAMSFVALLTDAQKTQLQQAKGVEAALRAAQALHLLGL